MNTFIKYFFPVLLVIFTAIYCNNPNNGKSTQTQMVGSEQKAPEQQATSPVQEQEQQQAQNGDTIQSNSKGTEKLKGFNRFPVTPVNDTNKDKGLSLAVNDINKAIKNKDKDLLLKYVDPDVKSMADSAQGNTPVEKFVKFWKLDTDAKNSEIWKNLERTISLGSKIYEKDKAVFPFFYFISIPQSMQSEEVGMIIGNNVNVREKPSTTSIRLKQLANELVIEKKIEEKDIAYDTMDGEKYQWHRIVMPTGYTGYVFGKFYRNRNDFRVILEKKNDTWKITEFKKGD